MQPLLERIKEGSVLVADGAMGTTLQRYGLEPGSCPESFNLTQPDILAQIARLFLDAGADILSTNTFGASPLKLACYDLGSKTSAINKAAARAVCGVAKGRAYVAGSVGPCGKLLKPHGDTDPEEVYSGFFEQIEALHSSGVDCIFIETMMDLAEAALAVRAAKAVDARIPVAATMTFDETPKGYFTIMGINVERAAAGLEEAGADIVGSNCGYGIDHLIAVAAAFRECTDLPLLIQPNAGLPQSKDGKLVYNESPELMAERVGRLLELGVKIIGGCCGTTPEHILAMRKRIYAHADSTATD